MRVFRLAMVQMNPTVGDVCGNADRIAGWLSAARRAKADLVAFPELVLTGYPPEDLLLKPSFLRETARALDRVVKACRDTVAIVGYVDGGETGASASVPAVVPSGGHSLRNVAGILAGGRVVAVYAKHYLPNYGVFDESRYFHPGDRATVVTVNGTSVGVNICEDIWYPEGPTRAQAAAGAEVIVNINASPFHAGKSRLREQMLATRARDNGVIVTYTNMVGGQDELVFDGNSLVLDQHGDIVARGKAFEEDLLVVDLHVDTVFRSRLAAGRKKWSARRSGLSVEQVTVSSRYVRRRRPALVPDAGRSLDSTEEIYRALVTGVRDYVRKNRFKQVLIGLSGGIDSALTAAVAADALGAPNVLGLFMPSPYTSPESGEDVRELSARLGVQIRTVPITTMFRTYLKSLAPSFRGLKPNETEENLQARIRGNLLMAFSNKFGHLVLTTGNKSEMSVGYATLYGDMAGGFAVIKDVPKTLVYELARWRNRRDSIEVIPKRILDRAPTAELRFDQKDEDALPPYPLLDPILKAYVEEDRSAEEIVAMGFQSATVRRVLGMVDRSEYKRRQAPIGIKITHRAFGKDRRMPVTNGYREP